MHFAPSSIIEALMSPPSSIQITQANFSLSHLRVLSAVLSLLPTRPRLALIALHGMQHDLDRIIRRIMRIALAPIITDRVRKNIPIAIERRRRDGPSNLWISFQSVLRVLVPEMEGAIAARRAECAVNRMEGNRVDGVHF